MTQSTKAPTVKPAGHVLQSAVPVSVSSFIRDALRIDANGAAVAALASQWARSLNRTSSEYIQKTER